MRLVARILACVALLPPVLAGMAVAQDIPATARVTRQQAVATALAAMPGRLGKVEIERKRGRWIYVVEVMTREQGERDVFVDLETGEVVGTD